MTPVSDYSQDKKLVINVTRGTCIGGCNSLPEIVSVAGLKNRFLKVRFL